MRGTEIEGEKDREHGKEKERLREKKKQLR